MINGNWPKRQKNQQDHWRDIEWHDMLRYYPGQVKENNQRLEIMDGQHSFWISRKLGRPVYYILVTEEKSMQEIAKINSNVEKWKGEDFSNCYCAT